MKLLFAHPLTRKSIFSIFIIYQLADRVRHWWRGACGEGGGREGEWGRGNYIPYCADLSWDVFHSLSSCLIMYALFQLMLSEIKFITANYSQNDVLYK